MHISKDDFLYQVTLSIKRYASVGITAAIVFTLLFFAVGGISQLAKISPNLQTNFEIGSVIAVACFAFIVFWIVNFAVLYKRHVYRHYNPHYNLKEVIRGVASKNLLRGDKPDKLNDGAARKNSQRGDKPDKL